jgi:acetyl esterase
MNLESEIAEYVVFCEQFDVPLSDDTIPLQRKRYNAMRAQLAQAVSKTLRIQDELVLGQDGHNIPIRIYQPSNQPNQPCCLFMHGGGFVVGNIETHHDWVAELAELSEVTIISIDYRLSPEHRYPAALHDVRDVLEHVANHSQKYNIDPKRMVVSGDSAGGNLSAAICLLTRDTSLPDIQAQLLIYPGLGGSLMQAERENSPLLKASDLGFYFAAYMGQGKPDKYAAPLLETDFSNLPPAFVLTVEFDPVRDDGLIYTQKLKEAGVPVTHYDAPGLVHGCMQARRTSPGTRKAFDMWAEQLKRLATSD